MSRNVEALASIILSFVEAQMVEYGLTWSEVNLQPEDVRLCAEELAKEGVLAVDSIDVVNFINDTGSFLTEEEMRVELRRCATGESIND